VLVVARRGYRMSRSVRRTSLGDSMSYRNKTYVAFASEDIRSYRLMEAWRENVHIDFSFFDAHDLYVSRDTSKPETIRSNLRHRMNSAKQFVLLASAEARRKGGDGRSFLWYEVNTMISLDLPIVIANLSGSREIEKSGIPKPLLDADYYTLSVSFQPSIIRFALDGYSPNYAGSDRKGSHYYTADKYRSLGL
jgi:hypothetical protein